VLMLTDNLPTGYHAVVGAGIRPGDKVVVIGDGAVGLLAAHTAGLFGPAAIILLGHHDDRLAVGKQLGATHAINENSGDTAAVIRDITAGQGPSAVVDCIASATTMRFSCETVRPGGQFHGSVQEYFWVHQKYRGTLCFYET
jgi:threonine dehydrogenase-like Zn-dependent dehydrogenase